MPLLPGKENIGRNITELREHGSRPRSEKQILAIALSESRRHPRADGGSAVDAALRIAHRAAGGVMPQMPYFERQEARGIGENPYGFSVGTGGGRLDKNAITVAPSSYVIPADIMAGLGDGNSLSGAHVWSQILASMPWGIDPVRSTGHRGPPPAPHDAALAQGITGVQKEPALADGGQSPGVPILAADGEQVLSPEDVLRVGQHYSPQRDLDNYPKSHDRIMRRAHQILDSWVKQQRGKTIRHLKNLRGPVGSKNANMGHI